MTLSAERLSRAKKDIADVVTAIKVGNDSHVSQEGHLLLTELMELDDAAWTSLLASVEENELREHLGSLRQRLAALKGVIQQVGHAATFDFSQQSLMINLRFHAGEESLVSKQDLEDTLWIGKAVLQVVLDVMRTMDAMLSSEAQNGCIGKVFEENLKGAEDAVGEIRGMFTAMHRTDVPRKSG